MTCIKGKICMHRNKNVSLVMHRVIEGLRRNFFARYKSVDSENFRSRRPYFCHRSSVAKVRQTQTFGMNLQTSTFRSSGPHNVFFRLYFSFIIPTSDRFSARIISPSLHFSLIILSTDKKNVESSRSVIFSFRVCMKLA